MLQAPVSSSAYRRGHAHKRSAAISGDFDLEFFKQSPSIAQQLSSSSPSQLPPSQFSPIPYLTPKTPDNDYHTFAPTHTPTIMISEPSPRDASSPSPSPSPKRHTRLNSWTYSSNKTKLHSENSKNLSNINHNSLDYSSSSSDSTPELKRQAIDFSYTIPEATIDLDLASGIYHNPSTPKSLNSNSSSRNPIFHRRTESAPELEDFLKYKMFTSASSNKNSGRNSAIFEEEDEDDEEVFSSVSSSQNLQILSNPSLNSLNSNSNSFSQSHISNSNTSSTPTSGPMRRGVSAKRFQNYYNNNLMLSAALRSSESLSNITSSPRPPRQTTNTIQTLTSSSSSLNSMSLNSPTTTTTPSSRFKFDSQVYDIPQKEESITTTSSSSLYYEKPDKMASTSSLSRHDSPKKSRHHKKSNSLFSTISFKIKRNSTCSVSKTQKRSVSDNVENENENDSVNKSGDDDYIEGDSTLTPFNLGEPGPELDLTTMIPRYNTSTNTTNDTNNDANEIFILSPEKKSAKKTKKAFFSWRKK